MLQPEDQSDQNLIMEFEKRNLEGKTYLNDTRSICQQRNTM